MPRFCPILVLAVACAAPPDAPEEFEELSAYLFERMGENDTRALEAGVDNLDAWLVTNLEASQDGYTVALLSQPSLDALEGDRQRDASALIGGAVATVSDATIDDLVGALMQDDQIAIYEDTYETFERTFRTPDAPDCFVARDCDEVVADGDTVTRLPLGIRLTSSYVVQYLWVDGPLGPVILTRSWLTEPATSDLLRLQEQFFLSVNLQTDAGLVRVQGVWADPEVLGLEVPEGAALNLLIDGLRDADALLYAWLDR